MAKKTTKKKAKRAPKPRAQRLYDLTTGSEAPDMGPAHPVDKKLTNALLAYMDGRDERMEATNEEVKLKGAVLDRMHELGYSEYVDHDAGVKVTIQTTKEKIKVRRVGDDAESGDTDGEE